MRKYEVLIYWSDPRGGGERANCDPTLGRDSQGIRRPHSRAKGPTFDFRLGHR